MNSTNRVVVEERPAGSERWGFGRGGILVSGNSNAGDGWQQWTVPFGRHGPDTEWRISLEAPTASNASPDGIARVDDVEILCQQGDYSDPDNSYSYGAGTSFAAPIVSGIAALILSEYPDLSPVQIKQAILDGVDTDPRLDGKVHTGGRVNAYRALLAAARLEPDSAARSTDSDGDDEGATGANSPNGEQLDAWGIPWPIDFPCISRPCAPGSSGSSPGGDQGDGGDGSPGTDSADGGDGDSPGGNQGGAGGGGDGSSGAGAGADVGGGGGEGSGDGEDQVGESDAGDPIFDDQLGAAGADGGTTAQDAESESGGSDGSSGPNKGLLAGGAAATAAVAAGAKRWRDRHRENERNREMVEESQQRTEEMEQEARQSWLDLYERDREAFDRLAPEDMRNEMAEADRRAEALLDDHEEHRRPGSIDGEEIVKDAAGPVGDAVDFYQDMADNIRPGVDEINADLERRIEQRAADLADQGLGPASARNAAESQIRREGALPTTGEQLHTIGEGVSDAAVDRAKDEVVERAVDEIDPFD